MKQLLTVGDSFTNGDELEDRSLAWPMQLGNRLGYQVDNRGESGSSNTSILRRTINYLSQSQYDLVVIGWTSPGRIEWKDSVNEEWDLWPGFQSTEFFKDTPWRQDLLNYINQYHSPEYLFEMYLIQVISLQSYCRVNNIPCVMINTQYQDYYYRAGMQMPHMGNLSAQVCKELFVDQGETAMSTIAENTPKGPGGHFLELGHQLVADSLYKHIEYYGLLKN